MNSVKTRDLQVDNIRCFLIFLVVFGHFLELFPGFSALYAIIYSFHMPAFFFIAGMFAKFDCKKISKHLLFPYLFFQTLYLLLLNRPLTYTRPFWIMWFLLVLFFYYLLVAVLPQKTTKSGIGAVCMAVAASLLAGYVNRIGGYLSMSRFFAFLPFFMMGYYMPCFKNERWFEWTLNMDKTSLRTSVIILWVAIVIVGEYLLINYLTSFEILWGRTPYSVCGCTFWLRLGVQLLAISVIGLLFFTFPKKPILGLTTLGENTLAVFLLHGFFFLFAKEYHLFHYDAHVNLMLAFGLSAGIVLLFGNPIFGKFFRKVF